jgi:S-adenosylmethionine:diacylglycerol 3-amino-3-carboxypropyl transferase
MTGRRIRRDPRTLWASGRLNFGRMFEDAAIELEVFAPGARVFCVASAGCTAFALAEHGCEVTAVDVNPAQVAYVRARLAGEPARPGRADTILARFRRLGSSAAVRRFCELDDPAEQVAFWDERLDSTRFRLAFASVLRPPARAAGLPTRLDRLVRGRLRRGFSRYPNRDNPYVRGLFLGELPPPPAADLPVRVETGDAAAFLERSPPASFDGFTFSNVLDGARHAYAERLRAAAAHAAAPGAIAVARTLAEPASPEELERATRDRAPLWGAIRVERVA